MRRLLLVGITTIVLVASGARGNANPRSRPRGPDSPAFSKYKAALQHIHWQRALNQYRGWERQGREPEDPVPQTNYQRTIELSRGAVSNVLKRTSPFAAKHGYPDMSRDQKALALRALRSFAFRGQFGSKFLTPEEISATDEIVAPAYRRWSNLRLMAQSEFRRDPKYLSPRQQRGWKPDFAMKSWTEWSKSQTTTNAP